MKSVCLDIKEAQKGVFNAKFCVPCQVGHISEKHYLNGGKVKGNPARVTKVNDLHEANINASIREHINSMEGKEPQKTAIFKLIFNVC